MLKAHLWLSGCSVKNSIHTFLAIMVKRKSMNNKIHIECFQTQKNVHITQEPTKNQSAFAESLFAHGICDLAEGGEVFVVDLQGILPLQGLHCRFCGKGGQCLNRKLYKRVLK